MMRLNLASGDLVMRTRMRMGADRSESLAVTFSDRPLPGKDFDAYAMPAEELLPFLEAFAPSVPIIAFGPPDLLVASFLAGCDDYLKDPWTFEELECRLRRFVALAIGGRGDGMAVRRDGIERRGKYLPITEEEYRILRAFAYSPEGAVSRLALQFALSGRATPGSRAVDVHISRLRKKVGELWPEVPRERIFVASRLSGYRMDICKATGRPESPSSDAACEHPVDKRGIS
jgi:hypothetical protein